MEVAARAPCLLYLIAISACDMRTRRIPDCMTGGALGGALCADIFLSCPRIPEKLFCAFLFFSLLGAVSFITKGMGLGDAKLAAVLGYCAGFSGTLATLALAAFLGMLGFCLSAICEKKQDRLPFAPFVALGYVIAEAALGRFL